jgi:hypothetical protein
VLDDSQATGGIFHGFEDYRTPTPAAYQKVLAEGLAVLDANILLNLYRYNDSTRQDLLAVMRRLGDNLWIPHQVMREFWRNREFTLDTLKDGPKEAIELLDKAHRSADNAISIWSKKVALPDDRRSELHKQLQVAFREVRKAIQMQAESDARAHAYDTNEDRILDQLSSVLSNKVGPALSPEDHAAAVSEAHRRRTSKVPPGYMDDDKNDPELSAGDYLVWEQLLREAEQRQCDVLFVTGDVKEDWWARVKGELRGPRAELSTEFRGRTQHSLYMLQPQDLLRRAGALTDVRIRPESAEEVERVNTLYRLDLPRHVRDVVLPAVYRKADEVNWQTLSPKSRNDQFTQWVDDPAVGGELANYFTTHGMRVWLKDGPMKEYLRAKRGQGPYARFVPTTYQSADEIVTEACGRDWYIAQGSQGTRPEHCIATNGTSTRYVCWGPTIDFKDLLFAALNAADETSIIVLLHDPNETISSDRQNKYSELAHRAGAKLTHMALRNIPNPGFPE